MKFIPKGKAAVRIHDEGNNVQCGGLLKKKGCDLLVGDGLLVARYDAVKLVDGAEKNVVIEEIISCDFSLVVDPGESPFAGDWPCPAKAKPKFVPEVVKPKA